jgi:hypothetical protein
MMEVSDFKYLPLKKSMLQQVAARGNHFWNFWVPQEMARCPPDRKIRIVMNFVLRGSRT